MSLNLGCLASSTKPRIALSLVVSCAPASLKARNANILKNIQDFELKQSVNIFYLLSISLRKVHGSLTASMLLLFYLSVIVLDDTASATIWVLIPLFNSSYTVALTHTCASIPQMTTFSTPEIVKG